MFFSSRAGKNATAVLFAASLGLAFCLIGGAKTVSEAKTVHFSEVGTVIKVEETPVYSGSELKPKVSVYAEKTGKALVNGRDYTLSYSNNVDAGTAYVRINGKGDYRGEMSKSFRITPKTISDSDVTFHKVNPQKYSGEYLYPLITITYKSIALKQGKDYSVWYKNNVNVGTGTLYIEGNGNYKGSASVPFQIVHKKLTSNNSIVTVDKCYYTGKELTPAVNVKLEETGKVLSVNSDYTVEYSDNIDAGEHTAVATVKGIGNFYGEFKVKFTISPVNMDKTEIKPIKAEKYTSEEIIPKVEVYYKNRELHNGVDYILTCSKNIEKGKAVASFKGIGNFCGTEIRSFNIVGGDISKAEVEPIDDQIYTGKGVKPDVGIYFNDHYLDEDIDYYVEYWHNNKPGTAKVKITGKGNMTGVIEKKFVILPDNPTKLDLKTSNLKSVDLSWSKVPYASGYNVYITDVKGKTKKLKTLTGTSASFTVDNAKNYIWEVKSFMKEGKKTYESPYAAEYIFEPVITSKKVDKSYIEISWAGAASYGVDIEVSKSASFKKAEYFDEFTSKGSAKIENPFKTAGVHVRVRFGGRTANTKWYIIK
ncbi:MAG: hypothetical protein J5786_02105 [Clostridiales bacterium]|nr:hypothetical protein [Clostridiales bacterium]